MGTAVIVTSDSKPLREGMRGEITCIDISVWPTQKSNTLASSCLSHPGHCCASYCGTSDHCLSELYHLHGQLEFRLWTRFRLKQFQNPNGIPKQVQGRGWYPNMGAALACSVPAIISTIKRSIYLKYRNLVMQNDGKTRRIVLANELFYKRLFSLKNGTYVYM